jgi:uncharacterized protein YggE
MDRYIEVTGEGQFQESAARFIAELTLEVRADKEETAMSEVDELCGEALAMLRRHGIAEDEIVEGGGNLWRPWYWKKQAGQKAMRRVILKAADFGRLNRALEQLEPLQSRNRERKTIGIEMQQPEFEESPDAKSNALAQAFQEARTKAQRLAVEMNCTLGEPLHDEEGGMVKRNSGFSGDEDWSGDSSRFGYGGAVVMMAAGAAAEPPPELQRPARTIFVRCRVRFAITAPQTPRRSESGR